MGKAIVYLFLLIASYTYSQTISRHVIASQGEFSSGSNGTLSWTIGEIVTETNVNLPQIITQGFQQPDSLMYTSIEEIFDNYTFSIYPNPVQNYLIIKSDFNEQFKFKLIDLLGNIILTNNKCKQNEVLNLSGIASGSYILKIESIKKETFKNIKIIKID